MKFAQYSRSEIARYQQRTWLEVSLPTLRENVEAVKQLLGAETQLAAVVKADAYGLGAQIISQTLVQSGVQMLMVACLNEALRLRRAGIDAPILLLSDTEVQRYDEGIAADLTYTISSLAQAEDLHQVAQALAKEVTVHINIDTGMGRLGFSHRSTNLIEIIQQLMAMPYFNVEGVFTHFATADGYSAAGKEDGEAFYNLQLERFLELKQAIEAHVHIPIYHSANSASIVADAKSQLQMVRAGLVLYGVRTDNMTETVPVKPIFRLLSRVALLKDIEVGDSVSYGRAYVAQTPRQIAVVPIGYADGYRRGMSGQAHVLIRGQKAPVIGKITMDQCMVDVSHIEGVTLGDAVVLMGEENGQAIRIEDLALWQDTIPYEVICNLSQRVPRIYVDGDQYIMASPFEES